VLGIELPGRPKPPDEQPKLDLALYTGTYEKIGSRWIVSAKDGELTVQTVSTSPLPAPEQPPMRLIPVSRELFLEYEANMNVYQPLVFSEFEDGRPRFAFSASRIARRVD
jgi:hypothetical protein